MKYRIVICVLAIIVPLLMYVMFSKPHSEGSNDSQAPASFEIK